MQDKPLTIGVIGLNFGRYVLENITKPPVCDYIRLGAVCDLDAGRVAEFSEQYGVKGYTSMDELLQAPEIDVIGLFTGPKGRSKLLRKIIESGKDVMTTKPFELNSAEARRILEEARSLGRIIHLNSPSPKANHFMEQIQTWEKAYHLGQLIYFGGQVVVSYREKADGRWLDDPEQCPVAPIFRLGIYLINDMVRLAGAMESVQVLSTRVFTERPTADNAILSIHFKNGAIGNIYASFCVNNGQFYGNSLVLHYENGSIFRNGDIFDYGTAMKSSHLRLVAVDENKIQTTQEWHQPGGSGEYAWKDFYDAVRARDLHSTPANDIVHGVEVIEAMMRAEKSGKTEKVGASA